MLFLVIVGIAAGFLATRLMRIEADVPTTIVIGIAGALIGGLLLRSLVALTSWAAGLLGAVLGAMALIWLYKAYVNR